MIFMRQTSSGDADLYVSFNAQPSIFEYDYRDTSLSTNSSISIALPNVGIYVIGVYGFRAASYVLSVTNVAMCASRCSNHGTCNGNTCSCSSGYTGGYCQQKTGDMVLGVNYPGYADVGIWNFWRSTPNSGSNLVITVNETGGAGTDCDIYAKAGANPTTSDFDYADYGVNDITVMTIPNPGSSSWYIGVYGFQPCNYGIVVTLSSACPNQCSGHGTCSNSGMCICNSGYGGADCSVASIPVMTNGGTYYASINSTNAWKYYQLNIQATSFLTIDLKEISTDGFLWLFVSKDSTPDTRNYDYWNPSQGDLHTIQIQFDYPATDTYFIGVYGSPFLIQSASYALSAWYSPI